MPLQKVDFQTAFIYKLECRDPLIPEKYWGSSCGKKDYRKHGHKSSCTNPNHRRYNEYKYRFIRQHGGWDNWVFIKVKDFPCANRTELNIEEQKYITLDPNCLNIYRAHQTEDDYIEQKKTHHRKSHIKEFSIKIDCPCGSTTNKHNVYQHNKSKKHLKYLSELELDKVNHG